MIRSEQKEILVQTVGVTRSLTNPLNTFLFFCPYCSQQMIQIQGLVTKIEPGGGESNQTPLINRCSRCGLNYQFVETKPSSERIRVELVRYKNPESVFRCYISRTPLLAWDASHIYQLPSATPKTLPFEVDCHDFQCPAKYLIHDIC